MKVVIVSGSLGKRSCTRVLLSYINDQLRTKKIDTVFWDLSKKALPMAIPEFHTRQEKHPNNNVREFVKDVRRADAFILGSPLYHDSFSGVLKNALDTLPNEAFMSKPVSLVCHSSNVRSCIVPCNHLRPVVRSLGGYAGNIQVGTTDADYISIGDKLELNNPKVKERIDGLISELISMSKNMKQ
jgi:azobenzene reductase